MKFKIVLFLLSISLFVFGCVDDISDYDFVSTSILKSANYFVIPRGGFSGHTTEYWLLKFEDKRIVKLDKFWSLETGNPSSFKVGKPYDIFKHKDCGYIKVRESI